MNRLALILMTATMLAPAFTHAADDKKMYPIDDAMNSDEAKSKLPDDVRFYFGDQKAPKGIVLGEWVTNKKTNGFAKDDKKACEHAFLSAMLELTERARKEGAKAVVNIRSYYKQEEISSNTEYMCGSGFLMSGVALKAKFIK